MSKNVQPKSQSLPSGKKSSKRPLNSSTSEDDDYSGVDLISDSEEDEPDVEEAEEKAIIESEEDDPGLSIPQPAHEDDVETDWAELDMLDDHGDLFEAELDGIDIPDLFTEAPDWLNTINTEEDIHPETARRVRFDLSSDSESALSDAEDNIFPDIFLDQESLNPTFRSTIENDHDNDNDDPPSDDGSYWDFEGEIEDVDLTEPPVADPAAEADEDNESESSYGSSGYETDEGETTEEDLPPAAKFLPARTVLRRPSTESSSDEEDIQVIRRNPYKPKSNGPRLGSWVTDAAKPFAILDSRGKKLMMFRARIQRRHSMNSTTNRPTLQTHMSGDMDMSAADQLSPMTLSNSANLMMSAMYEPMDGYGQALGPPEAFYPFVSINADGNMTQDGHSSSFDEDDIEDDEMWNIQDLIDFGDDTSDEEVDNDNDNDSGDSNNAANPSSTPGRPSTACSEEQAHPLLNHLNSNIVGAFRRNQTRHQLLSRNAASRESLAFSGRYGTGTIRGIKGGRLAAANTPITPMRKSKTAKAMEPTSPTPAVDAAERKRKFSGEASGHKRVRSLV